MKTAVFALALWASAAILAAGSEHPTGFRITTRRVDDAVEVRAEKGRTVFSVTSPFGISQAVIERTEDRWPEVVVLRLHLKGLESFKASNGKVTLEAAVSSQEGKPKARIWKDGVEDAPLDDKSPFWMDVRILAGDGSPAREIPLKDGYFEVTLPKGFFEGAPKAINVRWIDFYRS